MLEAAPNQGNDDYDDGLSDFTVPNVLGKHGDRGPVSSEPSRRAMHSTSKSNELGQVLDAIHTSVPELGGVMIASQEGLAIAHDFPEADAERIAAMAASSIGLGRRISERSGIGELAEVVLRGRTGYLVVYETGEDTILVMQGPLDANLGLMRIEARMAFVEIRAILSSGS
ncbi:roadblock/LC7 domain-containing protein [Arachnia propionica]|nr:roadblock/LC7 domain-containing protein [Arachnia propionica]MDO5084422.1 roadblock/LC7 domain-containing protein [Arachnia propionica]